LQKIHQDQQRLLWLLMLERLSGLPQILLTE